MKPLVGLGDLITASLCLVVWVKPTFFSPSHVKALFILPYFEFFSFLFSFFTLPIIRAHQERLSSIDNKLHLVLIITSVCLFFLPFFLAAGASLGKEGLKEAISIFLGLFIARFSLIFSGNVSETQMIGQRAVIGLFYFFVTFGLFIFIPHSFIPKFGLNETSFERKGNFEPHVSLCITFIHFFLCGITMMVLNSKIANEMASKEYQKSKNISYDEKKTE